MHKLLIFLGAIASAVTFSALPQQALAQDESADLLDEIVTTARRREESLQEVPIAVSTFSGEHLEEIGIAESMRRIMLNDRLLGIGVKEARMEILGGMVPGDDTVRKANLDRAYQLGKTF